MRILVVGDEKKLASFIKRGKSKTTLWMLLLRATKAFFWPMGTRMIKSY